MVVKPVAPLLLFLLHQTLHTPANPPRLSVKLHKSLCNQQKLIWKCVFWAGSSTYINYQFKAWFETPGYPRMAYTLFITQPMKVISPKMRLVTSLPAAHIAAGWTSQDPPHLLVDHRVLLSDDGDAEVHPHPEARSVDQWSLYTSKTKLWTKKHTPRFSSLSDWAVW